MNPLVLLAALPLMAMAPMTIAAMQWERRVLLVGASAADDAMLAEQRRVVARWKAEGEARDLSVVEVVGERVVGAADRAASLRRRYGLPASGFGAVLIGKDGGVKLRSSRPLSSAVLAKTIDAMPMRRSGGR
ncbi:DUF4174 domain-containing protein [Sphingomonas arantia]|uniref:DUF4174 domain-containing protein n=1 Tax=Sphingomonas arantia TaxID=1460676 RepID=A0ABW4TXX9_9SPHN